MLKLLDILEDDDDVQNVYASLEIPEGRHAEIVFLIRLLGIDPGLRFTGWGILESDGNRLRHVADGVISTADISDVPAIRN